MSEAVGSAVYYWHYGAASTANRYHIELCLSSEIWIAGRDWNHSSGGKVRWYKLPIFSFQITADASYCHNSPELTIPITVGSVPFIDNYHRLRRRPTAPSLKGRPKPLAPTDLIEESELSFENVFFPVTDYDAFFIDPPTYEQAVTTGLKLEKPENIYTPLYPVFRN